jgi:hypothetical protein
MVFWNKSEPYREEPLRPSKVKVVGDDKYNPVFDFDITTIPFLEKIEKGGIGCTTKLYFKTAGDIPLFAVLGEDLKSDGTWGYSSFNLMQVGRDYNNYSLIFEVGDNVIEYYFDIQKIKVAFQKLGFKIDEQNCKLLYRLQKMVEESNNLAYVEAIQRMRDRGETV